MEHQRLRDGGRKRSVEGDRRKGVVGSEPGEVEVTAQDGSPEKASKRGCRLKH